MSTASEATANGHAAEHVAPIKSYLKIYGALLALTYLTVQVSLWDLGDPAIYVALGVAIVKATLVALFFMHLRHDTGFNRFVFVSSLLFLVIFFGLTMLDLGTRGDVNELQSTFALEREKAAEARMKQEEAARPAAKPAARPTGP